MEEEKVGARGAVDEGTRLVEEGGLEEGVWVVP